MQYSIKKLKDVHGVLKDELDSVRARYAFPPFTPDSTSDDYVTVPDGKVFYMTQIEVSNSDTADHTFHIEDDAGNVRSMEYKVTAGASITIPYWDTGFTGKIHFVSDSGGYTKLTYRPAGYMATE